MDKRGKNTGFPRFYKNKRLIGSVNLPPYDSSSSKTITQKKLNKVNKD